MADRFLTVRRKRPIITQDLFLPLAQAIFWQRGVLTSDHVQNIDAEFCNCLKIIGFWRALTTFILALGIWLYASLCTKGFLSHVQTLAFLS